MAQTDRQTDRQTAEKKRLHYAERGLERSVRPKHREAKQNDKRLLATPLRPLEVHIGLSGSVVIVLIICRRR